MGRYPHNPLLEEVVEDAFLNKVGSQLAVGHAQFPFSHRCFNISRPLEVPDGWTNVLCAWQPYRFGGTMVHMCAQLACARSMMFLTCQRVLRSSVPLPRPTGWFGCASRWLRGVIKNHIHGIIDDTYCIWLCSFWKPEKPITPCGASRAAVMLARYCLCLSRGMDTRCWSPGPMETSTPRSTLLGFHRASLFSSFHLDMLSFPLWCWSMPGPGNIPCMPWRFALVIHLSSLSFATHPTGPATPLQKLSTKMQDNAKMSSGVLHGGAGLGDGFGMQCFSCL
jgi:hypothetical protein